MAEREENDEIPQPLDEDGSQVGANVSLSEIYHGSNAPKNLADLYSKAREHGLDVSMDEVKSFLASQPSYSLYRYARRRYPRNSIIARFPGQVLQIDIMDMQRDAEDGFKYVLVSYDSYSKYLSTFPMKDRKPSSVIAGLEYLVSSLPFKISNIFWDREGSFRSKIVQNWLKDKGIDNYSTTAVVKSPGVERSIRTLRKAISRNFEMFGTKSWVHFLPKFCSAYNNRKHSTTKQRPLDVANDPLIVIKPKSERSTAPKLPPVGAYVRLNQLRGTFSKESSGAWSPEYFRIKAHKKRAPIPMAIVEDLLGNVIEGSFYAWELQEVPWEPVKVVDVVHAHRKRKGDKEILVSYVGWPADYVEWIVDKD